MTYTPAHNLAKLLSLFHDNKDYDSVTILRGKDGSLDVRFLDSEHKVVAKLDCSLLLPNFPIVLEFLDVEDTKMEGIYGIGYPGLRNTFMLTAADESYTTEYWARRKKPKKASKRKSSRYKFQTKEERNKQVEAAKALLA